MNDGSGRFTRVPDAFRSERGLQGAPMSMAMADYDRDGFLDLYLCVYSFYYGAGEAKAGTPAPYHDAANGPPNVLFHNDGHGGFVDVTHEAGLDAEQRPLQLCRDRGPTTTSDGWPDLLVANDFGRKNLYHEPGAQDGKVTFEDVAAQAGVQDYAAGMSAPCFDYDGDGHLTSTPANVERQRPAGDREPGFMPEAPEEVRALYRHHARGQLALPQPGRRHLRGREPRGRRRHGPLGLVLRRLDFDSDGWDDLYMANGMVTRAGRAGRTSTAFLAPGRGAVAPHPGHGHSLRRRLARDQPAHGRALGAGHQRNVVLRNDGHGALRRCLGRGRAWISTRTAGPSPS